MPLHDPTKLDDELADFGNGVVAHPYDAPRRTAPPPPPRPPRTAFLADLEASVSATDAALAGLVAGLTPDQADALVRDVVAEIVAGDARLAHLARHDWRRSGGLRRCIAEYVRQNGGAR